MAINASKITTTDSLNQLREEFNQLISDVENLEKGIAVFNSFSANTANVHQFETNDGIIYNPPTSSGTLVVASELGGNVAGQITLTDESSDTENFITFANAATGGQALKTGGTNLTFNANTGILSTTGLSISDGGNIGSASTTNAITIASDGVVTLVDDLVIKNSGTIGSSSANDAITIASTGIVTFKDDILIKDSGTIGSASATDAITIASDGVVTLVDDLVIKDSGTIGSASDTDSISIDSTGNVNISQGRDGLKLNDIEIFKLIYPVGSIYISATIATAAAVATAFGGTWEVFGAGRVLVGFETGDATFGTALGEGGAENNTLDITQIPEHSHYIARSTAGTAGSLSSSNHMTTSNTLTSRSAYSLAGTTNNPSVGLTGMEIQNESGTEQTQTSVTNLQPYIVVYMYRRTAL
jgi:microcystin-dependent protein